MKRLSGGSSSSSSDDEGASVTDPKDSAAFAEKALKLHNELRAVHQAEPLELSEEVQDLLKRYNNYLATQIALICTLIK